MANPPPQPPTNPTEPPTMPYGSAGQPLAVPPAMPGAPPLGGGPFGSQGVLDPGRPNVSFGLLPRAIGLAIALASALAVWAGLTIGGDNAIVAERFPSIGETIDGFRGLVDDQRGRRNTLPSDLRATLWRYLVGLALGTAAGGAIGFVTGLNEWTRSVVDPLASFFRSIPAIAFAFLPSIWWGRDDRTIVVIVALVTFWTALGASAEAANNQRRGTGSSTIGAAMALRQTVGLGWWAAIGAEVIVGVDGLGALALGGSRFLDLGGTVAVIIIIGFVGLVLETASRILVYLARTHSP